MCSSDLTLVANMVETGRTPLLTRDELERLGFGLVLSPLTGLFSTVRAMRDSFALLRSEGSLRDHLGRLVDFDDFGSIVGLPEHRGLDEQFRP